ncbi:hypothetical protein QM012_004264 [Aureobasidium pullulans]|uniref:Copper-fist domain-containing protein n=1 Tax=Aureobasidium pullulans TaxID=5580 RepID=A0ABR0TU82_AURPU
MENVEPGVRKRKNNNNGRKAKKDRNPSKASPKDLIRVQNQLNGKIYKFACGTCISGHRAPHCDPKKHYDKILFRRPEPGRPPRDCGHPEQWVELQAGGIPTAVMYGNQRELEEAARDREIRERLERREANMYAYHQNAIPHRPAPPGPPFGYPAPITQYDQYAPYPPQPTHQLGFPFGNPPAPTMFERSRFQSQFQPAEAHPQPAPTVFERPGFQSQFYSAEGHPNNQNTSLSMNMQSVQQFAMDIGQQEQMAAQPSANPSQSCCSRKQAQPPVQSRVGTTTSVFGLPSSAPGKQFPCSSCASHQCTCITCPEVRQVASGAWSQSCGRGGHIDNTVVPKQEFTSYQESQSPFQESQAHFQGYNGFQNAPQDFSHMLSEQQSAQQTALEAPQLATTERFVQPQPSFGLMPVDFSTITDEEIEQAMRSLQDTTHMNGTVDMPLDFSNIIPMTSDPMHFQHPSQINGAEHLHLPVHIQQDISAHGRFLEVSSSPEASIDSTVDPRNLRVRPYEQ